MSFIHRVVSCRKGKAGFSILNSRHIFITAISADDWRLFVQFLIYDLF